jgi:hypothetical protein
VLDMGESVKITDLAKKMISLAGLQLKDKYNANGDIEINYSGLRPGEKLYEELLIGGNVKGTQHPRIMQANEEFIQLRINNKKHILTSSQDSWIFETPFEIKIDNSIKIGDWNCDGKILNQYKNTSIQLYNPCYSIKTIHLHTTGKRTYNINSEIEYVDTLASCYIGDIKIKEKNHKLYKKYLEKEVSHNLGALKLCYSNIDKR